jgi:invasion protein IalB
VGGWTILLRAALAFGLAAAAATHVLAQSAPAAAERFKDWELFCPAPNPTDKPRVCEVRTVITGKEGARLGALAIALNPEPGAPERPMIATALLPLGVDLKIAPAMKVGENKPLLLEFHRCLQRGCEAVAAIDGEALWALRAGTLARVAVGIGGGKTAVFEFSLAGFSAAHDAMKKRSGRS